MEHKRDSDVDLTVKTNRRTQNMFGSLINNFQKYACLEVELMTQKYACLEVELITSYS